ncbi:MAG: PKD domain-containing protein [bacterium]
MPKGLLIQIELRRSIQNIVFVIVGILAANTAWAQYEFIENKGQWDNRVQYRAKVPSGYLHLEQTGFNWFFYDDDAFGKIVHHHNHHDEDKNVPEFYKYHVLKVDFVNANATTTISATSPSKPYYNYYFGKNPERWAAGVKGYYQLKKENIWDGVDMKLYSSPQGLKYDFIVAPNTPINTIQLRYSGQDAMVLDDGKLKVKTSVNTIIENIPEAYQYINKRKVSIKCRYTLKNGVLGFEVEDYNKNYALVIDPVLVFVTYSGTTADNFGFTATYDSRGRLYAGGNVTEPYPILPNGKYPTTAGAFQQNFKGNGTSNGPYSHFPCDIAISKYDSSGQNLLYATYIGGTDNDYPHSLVVDEQDRLVMLGSTYSTDFPVLANCYDTSKANGVGNSDIVIVKFNDNGTALLGSTFVGGNGNDGINAGTLVYNFADDFRGDVLVGFDGNVLVATCSNSGNFPRVKAAQNTKKAGYDGVAFSLDSTLENLVWSTFLGGSGNDALYSIKIDDKENIVVGGGTTSNDLDVSANALHDSYLGGSSDGYVAVFDSTADRNLKHLTYYGSDQYDQIYFVDIDRENFVYVAGQTEGNIPMKGAGYGQPNTGQFISKLSRELDTLLLNTTVGNRVNNPDISPTAFLVDNCNNIYISGWGSDISAPGLHAGSTNGLPVSTNPPALQPTTDGNDFWVAVLTPNAQGLLYATFFGGTQTEDHVDGGTSRFDKRGVIYQSVCGSCPGSRSAANFVSDMPTTTGAAYETNLSPRCSNTSFKLDFQITYAVDAKFDVTPILGCNPMTVNVTDKSFNALNYQWDFGDGTTDTVANPNHTYTQAGKYTITLIISNPNSCNLADSFTRTVEVLERTTPEFDLSQEDCESEKATFTNQSANALGFLWRFGDGTTSTDENPEHTFDKSGTYNVTLITNPGTLCEDSLTKSITLKDYSNSDWEFPNVFTPKDVNGLNDCYTFEGLLVDCDKITIEIFNRWGELVWKTENPADCWDGTHYNNGKELPAGVYFVIANLERLKGDKLNYTGSVTLIR